ncbi:MAG: glycosyltransferase [Bacteroidetes bacterium]|nr:glycosyltransferase [Bacteroidota bacterium]
MPFFWIWIFIGMLLYGTGLFLIAYAFNRPNKRSSYLLQTTTGFSVIIPFRNEKRNLPGILASIKDLNYPPECVEFIFCNDHSTDESDGLPNIYSAKFNTHILHLPEGKTGKKNALEMGIACAKFPYVITTDADCVFPPGWLNGFDEEIQRTQAVLLTGPVVYTVQSKQWVQSYQQLENAALITIGAFLLQKGIPAMANGANLCFSRQAFIDCNGYEGNRHIASGDDAFLLEKMHEKYPGKVHFLHNQASMVSTPVQQNWSAFIQQRRRWAAKVRFQANNSAFLGQLIFLHYCLLMVFLFFWYALHLKLHMAAMILGMKVTSDLLFFALILPFFRLQFSWVMILRASLLQPILVPLIAVLSLAGKFEWKDRKYRR